MASVKHRTATFLAGHIVPLEPGARHPGTIERIVLLTDQNLVPLTGNSARTRSGAGKFAVSFILISGSEQHSDKKPDEH
jgi:hypothetical protein